MKRTKKHIAYDLNENLSQLYNLLQTMSTNIDELDMAGEKELSQEFAKHMTSINNSRAFIVAIGRGPLLKMMQDYEVPK